MVLKHLFRKKCIFRGIKVERRMRKKGLLGLKFPTHPVYLDMC